MAVTRSIDISRAGMLRQAQGLDVAAHNVSNANTPGFKALRAALETGEQPRASAPDLTTETETPPLTGRLNVGRLLTQGPLRETGSSTDFAISGEGFFVVRMPDGTDSYTRNGAFHADPRGRLLDGAGNPVQPGISLPRGATGVRVEQDGTVSATLPNGGTATAGRITLALFPNPGGLVAGLDGRFAATTESGRPQLVQPGQGGAGRVRAGMVEDANIDLADQMSALMTMQRGFQLNSSAFRMADDMLRMAGQLSGPM